MKIIVATDSYKGTINAPDATAIIADALAEKLPLAQILRMPIADGGEGSAECLVSACGGGYAVTTVKNCFFEDAQVRIGLVGEGDTAIVELAEAAGLRYAEGRANPMFTTTYGVGQMIRTAAGLGVRRILLCLGGSATNDLGLGAAAATRRGAALPQSSPRCATFAALRISEMRPRHTCAQRRIALRLPSRSARAAAAGERQIRCKKRACFLY